MKRIFVGETADVFPGIIARNKAVLDYEKYIHRTFYPYIIHPYSRLRIYWEIFNIIFSPFQLTIFFFFWAFERHNSFAYQFVTVSMQMFRFVNLVSTFFTGYVEPKTEIVVLDPRKIARRYLLRRFIFDLFSCIPFELIVYIIKEECIAVSALGISKPCQLVVLLTAAGFFSGVVTFAVYIKNTGKVFLWDPFLPNVLYITYYFFLVIIFNFAFLFIYILYDNKLIIRELDFWSEITVFFEILCSFLFDIIFLHVSFVVTQVTLQLPILILNFFFSIFCSIYFIKYIIGKMKARERFFFLENRVKSFSRRNNLPLELQKKIILYFNILLKNKYHREDEIFNYVPDTFKGDIFFHFCLPLLKSFHAFEDFPTYVLRRLAERLQYQLYLPNDLVISKKEPKLSMYFIQKGTVALYSSKHIELYHFEAESSITGRYFIEGRPLTNHYAISIEVTEVYRLDYEDFAEIMAAYPKLLNRTKKKFYSTESRTYDVFESVFDS